MAYQGLRAEKKKNDGTLLGIFGLVGTILVVLVVFLCLGRKTTAPDAPTQPPTLPPPAENPYAERDFTTDENGSPVFHTPEGGLFNFADQGDQYYVLRETKVVEYAK